MRRRKVACIVFFGWYGTSERHSRMLIRLQPDNDRRGTIAAHNVILCTLYDGVHNAHLLLKPAA